MLAKPAATLHVGGGVWRTKWFSSGTKGGGGGGVQDDDWCLALACMQGGSCIAQYSSSSSIASSDSDGTPCSLAKALTHPQDPSLLTERHLAYGIGVLHEKEGEKQQGGGNDNPQQKQGALLASCSFYENSVHLWKLQYDGTNA
jgi:hypothetical protein